MKTLTDMLFKQAVDNIDRFPQSLERRNHLKANASIVIYEQGPGLANATNQVGYVIRAALNMLSREENQASWVSVSLDEENEDGRLKFEPSAIFDFDGDEFDPESQLAEHKQEFCDSLRVIGLNGIAKLWGCSVRNVQIKFKKLLENERDIAEGKEKQGDLFGGRDYV